jgi:ketosteroid isomerase-like protein
MNVEHTVEMYQKLIHEPSLELTKKIFLEDAVLISGTNPFYGPVGIYTEFLINLLYQKYSTVELVKEDLEIKYLDDTSAIAIFHYHTECVLRENGQPHGIAGIETQVLRKHGDEWKIAHVHYASK